jgi:hypothetical protein
VLSLNYRIEKKQFRTVWISQIIDSAKVEKKKEKNSAMDVTI